MRTGRQKFIWLSLGMAVLISTITGHALHNARGVMLEPAQPKWNLDLYPTRSWRMSNDQMWSLVHQFFIAKNQPQTLPKIEPMPMHISTESTGGGLFAIGTDDSQPWFGFGYGPLTYYEDFGPGPHYDEWVQNPPGGSTSKPPDLELFPPSNVGGSTRSGGLTTGNDSTGSDSTPPARIPEPASLMMLAWPLMILLARRK